MANTQSRRIVGYPPAVLMAFAGALALMLGTSASANAQPADVQPIQPMSAIGSTAIDSFSYSFQGFTIDVPAGCFLTHTNDGGDGFVNSEVASFDCAGPAALSGGMCNY